MTMAPRRPPTPPRISWRVRLAIALAVLAGGCMSLPGPRTDDTTLYVLAPEVPSRAQRGERAAVVEVAAPRAAPGYDTARIAYVRRPYELDYFAASRWADTPSRMLAPLVARALEQTGSFKAVVQAPGSANVTADYRLDTEIVRLRQDFTVQPSQADMELRVQLVDVRTRQVVATRSIVERETASAENAAGGVAAANAALRRALEQVADFCVEQTSRR